MKEWSMQARVWVGRGGWDWGTVMFRLSFPWRPGWVVAVAVAVLAADVEQPTLSLRKKSPDLHHWQFL